MLNIAEVVVGREDRTSVTQLGDNCLLVVADGAGGIGGGVEAADKLVSLANSQLLPALNNLTSGALCDFLSFADIEIANLASAGETTAVVVVIKDGILFGASVGDSEAWAINGRKVDVLTENQIRKPLLGSQCANPVPFERPALSDVLVLGTDGLFKYAKAIDIQSTVCGYTVQDSVSHLLSLVQLPSGTYQDDIGIILCKK